MQPMDNASCLLQSKNTRTKVYEYYSDIKSYPKRYPEAYGNITEIKDLADTLEVQMLLNINFADEKYSSDVQVTARYTFIPQQELRYEVIDGYGKVKIRNSITIKEPSNHAIKRGYLCEVEVNHLPLDIICIEPHGLENTDPIYDEYVRKGVYLQTQDHIYLEWDTSLQEIVTKCPKCGESSLEYTGPSETIGYKKTLEFKCDKCGATFKGISLGSSDGLDFHD